MHCEPAEVDTSALDALLCIQAEALPVEKWTGSETGVGRHFWRVAGTQCRLDVLIKGAGNTATRKSRMNEQKVEVTIVCVSKTDEGAVDFSDDRVKMSKARLPTCRVCRNWCPGGNLVRRVVGSGQ